MKKGLVIILIAILVVLLVAGIFHRSIIKYVWESKVNFDQEKQNQALNDWKVAEDAKYVDESQKLKQMCELTLYPKDCNEQPEWRENCLKCEQAGLKRVMEKPIDNSTKTGRIASSEEEKSRAPVIKNLAVNFANYNSETKKAGDFLFTINPAYNKILGEFGQIVSGRSGSSKVLPHYTYGGLSKDTPITSIYDGEVIAVWYQEATKDYEIHIKPVYDSYWDISFDHVINPTVKENQTVEAGDVVAYAGEPLSSTLEILLINEKKSPGTFYPILLYFDSATKVEYEQKVWKLMSDWEAYKNNNNIYDESKMTSCAGCLKSSVPNVRYD